MENPTEKERELIPQLRENVKDLDLPDWQIRDVELVRWIRAREGNLKNTEIMFRKHITWRKKYSIDKLVDFKIPKEVFDKTPYELWGYDHNGYSIIYVDFGLWKNRELHDKFEEDVLFQCFSHFFEFCMIGARTLIKERGAKSYQGSLIVNMKNLQLSQINTFKLIKHHQRCAKLFEGNYPETTKNLIIINAPKIFTMMYAIFKPFMSEHTLEKVKIISNEEAWKDVFYKFIPINVISPKLGGTNNYNIRNDITTVVNYKENCLNIPYIPNFETIFKDFNKKCLSDTIPAGEKLQFVIHTDSTDEKIFYKFETVDYNIGFSIQFEDEEDIFEYNLMDSHKIPIVGFIKCPQIGKYTFCFDNSYSKLRAKMIKYFITLSEDDNKI